MHGPCHSYLAGPFPSQGSLECPSLPPRRHPPPFKGRSTKGSLRPALHPPARHTPAEQGPRPPSPPPSALGPHPRQPFTGWKPSDDFEGIQCLETEVVVFYEYVHSRFVIFFFIMGLKENMYLLP